MAMKQVMEYLQSGTIGQEPSTAEKRDLILSHYDDILSYYGERKGVPFARKHLSWYCAGFEGSAQFRNELNTIKDPKIVREKLNEFFGEHIKIAA